MKRCVEFSAKIDIEDDNVRVYRTEMNSASIDKSNRIDDLINTFLNDTKSYKNKNSKVMKSMSDNFFDNVKFQPNPQKSSFAPNPYFKPNISNDTNNYTMHYKTYENEINLAPNYANSEVGSFINSSQTYDVSMYSKEYIPKNAQSKLDENFYRNYKKEKILYNDSNSMPRNWNEQMIYPNKCNNIYDDTLISMYGCDYDNFASVPNGIALENVPMNDVYRDSQPTNSKNFYMQQNSNFLKNTDNNVSPIFSVNNSRDDSFNVYNRNVNTDESTHKANRMNNSTDQSTGKMSVLSPIYHEYKYKKGKRTSNHNVIEKRYRMSINDKIMELKQILTSESELRVSKAMILKLAIARIKHLQSINRELNLENKKLKQAIYCNGYVTPALNTDDFQTNMAGNGHSENAPFGLNLKESTEHVTCNYPDSSPIMRSKAKQKINITHPRTNVYAFILLCALFSFNPCSVISSTFSWYPIFGKMETKSIQTRTNVPSRVLFSVNNNPSIDESIMVVNSSAFSVFYIVFFWGFGWMINFVIMMILFKFFFFLPRQKLLSEKDSSTTEKLKKSGPAWEKEEWDQLHKDFDLLSKKLEFGHLESISNIKKKFNQKNEQEYESCNTNTADENSKIRNKTLQSIMAHFEQYDTIKFVENIGFLKISFALFIQIIFYIFNFFLNPYIMMNRVFTTPDYLKIAYLYDRMLQICFHEICTTEPKKRRKHLNILSLYFAFSSLNAVKNVKTKNYLDQKIAIYFNASIICRLVCPDWIKKIMHRYFCRRAMRLYYKLNKPHDTFHWLKHPLGNKFFFSDEGKHALSNSFKWHDFNLSRQQFTFDPLIKFKQHFVCWLFNNALINSPKNLEYPTTTNFPRPEDTMTPLMYLGNIKNVCSRRDDYEIVEFWWCSYIELSARWPFCNNEKMKRMTYSYKYIQKSTGNENFLPLMNVSILLYFSGQIVINFDNANLNHLQDCIHSIREQFYIIVTKFFNFSDTCNIILFKFFDWLIICKFKALSYYQDHNEVYAISVAKNIEKDIAVMSTICLRLHHSIKSDLETKIKLHKTMLLILKRVNLVILLDQVK
ncbi:hypothetical protein A3Q56_04466 [Intoshia linei]|uniref:BHLH domain-containing protein n=1 Tax=Intoshia linei TaxID=1819745 RepID=A0A177B113_9BILA|nr:hypothetical protein A3Q56_04466 [Intoshia linei]